MGHEILQPTPASRRNFLLLFALLALGGAVLSYGLEPMLYVKLRSLDPCARVQALRGLLLGALLLSLLLGIVLLRYALRLRRADQFPLTARWLLRPTRVSRGPAVTALCLSLGLAGAALLGMTAMLGSALLRTDWLRAPSECQLWAQTLVNADRNTT